MGQEETSELVDELGLGIDSEITYIKWSNIDKDVSFRISKFSQHFWIFSEFFLFFILELLPKSLILFENNWILYGHLDALSSCDKYL